MLSLCCRDGVRSITSHVIDQPWDGCHAVDMTAVQRVIERYIDVWNATDPGRRRELIGEVFTADAAYSDPLAAVRGRDAIDEFHRSRAGTVCGFAVQPRGSDRCAP